MYCLRFKLCQIIFNVADPVRCSIVYRHVSLSNCVRIRVDSLPFVSINPVARQGISCQVTNPYIELVNVLVPTWMSYSCCRLLRGEMKLGLKCVTWWRHQMETFSALLALCVGNSPVTGEFPSQRPVTRSFDVSLIWAWTNGWVNNRDADDLRRHGAHYDVTVMEPVVEYMF